MFQNNHQFQPEVVLNLLITLTQEPVKPLTAYYGAPADVFTALSYGCTTYPYASRNTLESTFKLLRAPYIFLLFPGVF